MKKTKYLVIGSLVSYNRGLKDIFLGFSNKKIGEESEDKQHERSIVSGEQRKKPICTQLWVNKYMLEYHK